MILKEETVMKRRKLLLTIVLAITFLGGFFSGILVTQNNIKTGPFDSSNARLSLKKPQTKETPNWKAEESKVLIGYVQDFRDPNVINYSKLTHVVFSFVHPAKDGKILLNGDQALKNLRTIVANAEKHDTKVILAIGGWYHINGGESYDYFKTAISNPDSRAKLVNELDKIADRENLDGIDVDFEHPRSNEDAQNLDLFIRELYSKLHPKNKELSIAVHAKIHGGTGTEAQFVQYKPDMFQFTDYVNIMAYDGQWDGGYNAANLSPYPFTEKIVTYWSNLFTTHHLSKEKLVLGVPFYAQPENPAIKQISYAAIINSDPANAARDTVEMNGTTYHYNGDPTIQKKTKLAMDNGFGGMMLWEAGLDAQGAHSLTGTISKVMDDISENFVKK